MDERKFLIAVVVLAVTARVALWAMVPVTADAVYHYSIARYIAGNWRIPSFEYATGGDPMWYPPLFHITAAFFYALSGSERITPLVFSILSLLAFYLLLRRFYPRLLLPGMVLASFMPTQVYYGAIGYLESLFFLLAPLILYYYLAFLETKNGRNLAAACLLSAACFLTHYQGFIPIAAISLHLMLRDRKTALAFLISALLISMPWYLRNDVVFGNPIWPLLFDGRYPAHGGYQPSMMVNVLNPSKWVSLFFEYWVGAPNSGEDFAKNVEVVSAYLPHAGLFFAGWVFFVAALSLMALFGLLRFLRNDRNGLFFMLLIAVSFIPLLLSNFVRMLAFAFPVFILGLSESLDYVRLRLKLTSVFISLSLRFSPAAGNLNLIASALKRFAFAFFIVLLLSPAFAYGLIYWGIVGRYVPFYVMADELLPEGAVVCNMMDDVFFDRVHRTVVSVGSILEYRVTLECIEEQLVDSSGSVDCFKKFGIGYVCCTSLRTDSIGGPVRDFCGVMKTREPVFEYAGVGVWGGCWKV